MYIHQYRMVNQVWPFIHLMLVLVRLEKKTAGNSYTTFNHDQDEVDNFVDNYSKSNKVEGEVMTSLQPTLVLNI